MKPEIFEEFLVHMFCGIVAIYSVVSARIVHHIDRLVRADTGLHKFCRVLGMDPSQERCRVAELVEAFRREAEEALAADMSEENLRRLAESVRAVNEAPGTEVQLPGYGGNPEQGKG